LTEQLEGTAYNFCKSKLEALVAELVVRNDRNRFHFYFGDSLELCLANEEWKNKFHVIHCPNAYADYVKLTNLLPVVSQCLNGDFSEAVLVTEIFKLRIEGKSFSLVDTVEHCLKCPLTMIPTVYGVKLLDHLRLGISVGYKLHDRNSSRSAFALTWTKAPIAYSTEIQLELSPALKSVFTALVEECFIQADSSLFSAPGTNYHRSLFLQSQNFVRNSPLTFFNILQSLMNRDNLVEGTVDSLIRQCLPPRYHLAWRTLQHWMTGEEVLLFYTNDEDIRKAILNFSISFVQFVLKSMGGKTRYRTGEVLDENFFSDAHFAFNLNWEGTDDEFVVSFLLPKDQSRNSTAKLFVIDADTKKLLYSVSLRAQSMQRQVVTNPNPRRFVRPSILSNPSIAVRCQESEDEYQLNIDTRKIKLQSSEGKFS